MSKNLNPLNHMENPFQPRSTFWNHWLKDAFLESVLREPKLPGNLHSRDPRERQLNGVDYIYTIRSLANNP